MTQKEILIRLDQLHKETTMTQAIYDPAQYKANMKEIEKLQKKLVKYKY